MAEIVEAIISGAVVTAVCIALLLAVSYKEAKRRGISVWEELFREDED